MPILPAESLVCTFQITGGRGSGGQRQPVAQGGERGMERRPVAAPGAVGAEPVSSLGGERFSARGPLRLVA